MLLNLFIRQATRKKIMPSLFLSFFQLFPCNFFNQIRVIEDKDFNEEIYEVFKVFDVDKNKTIDFKDF